MKRQFLLSLTLGTMLVAPVFSTDAFEEDRGGPIVAVNRHEDPAYLLGRYKLDNRPSQGASLAKLEHSAEKNRVRKLQKQALKPQSSEPPVMKLRSGKPVQNVDLRKVLSPIQDQGEIGSCTSHALEGCIAAELIRGTGKYINFSRLGHYYHSRDIMGVAEGNEDMYLEEDSGATIADAAQSIDYGLIPETVLPYSDKNDAFKQQPRPTAYKAGLKYFNETGVSYNKVASNVDAIKGYLQKGKTVMFGIQLFESFMSSGVAKTGMVPMPNTSTEQVVGGHAMLFVGYDDRQMVGKQANPYYQHFIVRNSWSTNWGDNGYCYIPYTMVSSSSSGGALYDLWNISKIVNTAKVESHIAKGKLEAEDHAVAQKVQDWNAEKAARAFSLNLEDLLPVAKKGWEFVTNLLEKDKKKKKKEKQKQIALVQSASLVQSSDGGVLIEGQ
ncbi:MAG: C1 family peptidase [Alphaproteobacteria bacterium]|nr:C1 family peptidase [Alphaproteobacteria bacterium]